MFSCVLFFSPKQAQKSYIGMRNDGYLVLCDDGDVDYSVLGFELSMAYYGGLADRSDSVIC